MILSFNNSKGGVAKSSSCAVISYLLYKRGRKVLSIDTDPQANYTDMLLHTSKNLTNQDPVFKVSLMEAIRQKNLNQALVHIASNWDLLGTSSDFSLFPQIMESLFKNNYQKRVTYFWKLLEPLAKTYDFVVIDTPPTMSLIVSSALYGVDYSTITMQTEEYGLSGAKSFIDFVQKIMIDTYHSPRLDITGVLPVMRDVYSSSDETIMSDARHMFKSDLFNAYVPIMKRVKRFSITGLDESYYSSQVYDVYNTVLDELLERIKKLRKGENK